MGHSSSDFGLADKMTLHRQFLRSWSHFQVLSRGQSQNIFLAKELPTGTEVVIKVHQKHHISSKQLDHLWNELSCLIQFKHPLSIKLIAVGQTEEMIFIVTEKITPNPICYDNYYGPSLLDYSLSVNLPTRKEETTFFLAQICLVLKSLHQHQFIHRDIKPQNILLDYRGYIRLIDYGLCKKPLPGDQAQTLCGTPQYLAPEVVQGLSQSFTVDWWSLGVLAYELIEGGQLFQYEPDSSPMALFSQISNFRTDSLKFVVADEIEQGLIKGLLVSDPSQRMCHGDEQEAVRHEMFKGIEMDGILGFGVKTPLDRKSIKMMKRLGVECENGQG